MIDSHCHLADRKFAEDLPQVLERAREAGITHIITIADTLDEAEKCLRIAEQYEGMFCTAGVHPHAAKLWKEGDLDVLQSLLGISPKMSAVGEIGLDYHYDFSPRDVQQLVFRQQLELAKSMGLPAVVHCREAIVDVRRIVEEVMPAKLVLHCCTERWEDVAWLVDRGYFLSFTGIATYSFAEHMRETIRRCPLEQLMIETDAPYLAPEPDRGRRNEPAFVREVCALVASLKGISAEEADAATARNAVEFFGLPA